MCDLYHITRITFGKKSWQYFPELIDATGGGLLCEPDNPRDLANSLAKLMAHPAEADQMGTRGRKRVQTHFNSKRMAEQTLAVYENLAKYRVRRR